ncbi:RelE toxin of RelEB toxin-antitoxin system [Arcicella aurantiaca]|uniref:RelE toxin of RelEB toxin-antitoxin system n=1 Tax=Arcicella aurantiaca TaxID=591202 RepID=A0A316DYZ2_9BACT|nr:type II toxin-antitoxin system RelE/ParE family toxin [Arcicella aurantiaca]PWK23331.1 RelE toxin of RelEB toxin-antitoxin system [Arcicella aurantiaca]
MSYQVESIENFEKEAKRLKKKYPSLKDEILDLIEDLEENPFLGTAMRDGFYKIRLKIKSKGKGKSGGARVITCVKVVLETVYLVSIYDKSDQTDISDGELDRILGII